MKENMKIAVIGLNGIGSYFVRNLNEAVKKDIRGFNSINPMGIDLIDYDTIEEINLSYTLYDIEHLDRKKAEVLAELYHYNPVVKKVEELIDIALFDFIILCVDNNTARKLIYNSGIPFLDLRAQAKTVMAYLTRKGDRNYIKLTKDNGKKGSCQLESDIEERNIQFGNKIVASIGIQLFKDYLNEEFEEKQILMAF